MTQKRSLLRAAVILLAVLLLSVFAFAAAETAEAPQQTVFVFDQDREMDLWQQDKTLRVFCIPVGAQDCYFITCEGHAIHGAGLCGRRTGTHAGFPFPAV